MKNVLKLLCLLVVLQLGVGSARAARLTALVNEYTLEYKSVDANNNIITLSERIYVNKKLSEINFIMLSNHPTTTRDALVPTGSDPQIPEVKYMCDGTELCMVVAPDYIGYGTSKSVTHPYMCSTLTARNIVDGLVAAIDFIQTKKTDYNYNYHFNSSYYTLNVGYSQGGAATLAVHKYLETVARTDVQNKVKLKKSICGAGPHLQTYMFDTMEPQTDIFYPVYLPLTIEGMRSVYAKSTLRDLTREEIFTDKFLNTKNSDGKTITDIINAKATEAADLNTIIKQMIGTDGKVNFYDIIRPEYKNRNSKLYRGLRKALTQCDLLDGWKPEKPIIFYHWSSDEVVPFAESQKAYDMYSAMGCSVTLQKAEDLAVDSYWQIKNYDQSHMGYGTKFYLSIFSGSLR